MVLSKNLRTCKDFEATVSRTTMARRRLVVVWSSFETRTRMQICRTEMQTDRTINWQHRTRNIGLGSGDLSKYLATEKDAAQSSQMS